MTVTAFQDMTVRELAFLAALPRYQSLRSAALAHDLSAVATTRLVQGIERKLNQKLVERSHQGIALTQRGERLALAAAKVLRSLRDLEEARTEDPLATYPQTITVASRGFLNVHLAPAILTAFGAAADAVGLRFLDLSPDETADALKAGFLDVAVTFENADFGRQWSVRQAGAISWGVYARAGHPLASGATRSELAHYRLAHHAYWNGKNIISTESVEHGSLGIRQLGHGTQTAAAALALIAATDQIACIPCLLAVDAVRLGRVTQIVVADWPALHTDIFVGARNDRLTRRQFQRLTAAIQDLVK